MNGFPLSAYDCRKGELFMSKVYDIYMGGETVGKVQVFQEGLYYRFSCRCRLCTDVMYRLIVSCDDMKEDLGICVPCGDQFGLDCRLPIKRLGYGKFRFSVVPKHTKLGEDFIPIDPQEPFTYLTRLKDAYLQKRNGKLGICLKTKSK